MTIRTTSPRTSPGRTRAGSGDRSCNARWTSAELALAQARPAIVEKQRGAGLTDESAALRATLDVTEGMLLISRLTARLRTPQ